MGGGQRGVRYCPIRRGPCAPPTSSVMTGQGHIHVRQFQADHLEKRNAAAEDIRLRRDFASPHLGRHRRRRAHRAVVAEVPRAENLGHAEVDDHDMRVVLLLDGGDLARRLTHIVTDGRARPPVRHEHNVRRLNVKVNDASRMDVRDGEEHLLQHIHREGFLQGHGFGRRVVHLRLQVTAGAEVHDEVHVLGVLEDLVQLGHMGMVDQAEILDLRVQHTGATAEAALRDALHGSLGVGPNLAHQLNLAVGAAAQPALDAVDLVRVLEAPEAVVLPGHDVDLAVVHIRQLLPEGGGEAVQLQRTRSAMLLLLLQEDLDGTASAQELIDVVGGAMDEFHADRAIAPGRPVIRGMLAEQGGGFLVDAAIAEDAAHPLEVRLLRLQPRPQHQMLLLQLDGLRLHVDHHMSGVGVDLHDLGRNPTPVGAAVVVHEVALHVHALQPRASRGAPRTRRTGPGAVLPGIGTAPSG
mmetsp:Transcript_70923/g.205599  ORF Transcript_70923/g.205599 Transcript_70923/m.205599 type:complete len:467 (-) Transcript_70923:161-1561(-)